MISLRHHFSRDTSWPSLRVLVWVAIVAASLLSFYVHVLHEAVVKGTLLQDARQGAQTSRGSKSAGPSTVLYLPASAGAVVDVAVVTANCNAIDASRRGCSP